MKTVYRVQNKDGYGPYVGTLFEQDAICKHTIKRQPCPDYDNKLALASYYTEKYSADYRYGFKTVKAARTWFNSRNAWVFLNKKGFNLYRIVFEGSTVIGDTQVLFKPDAIISQTLVPVKFHITRK